MAIEVDPVPLFSIAVSQDDVGPVIGVAGEVDLATAPALRDALMAAIGTSPGPVSVDLADVTFMDSTGLSVLIMAHNRLDSQERQLRLRTPSPEVTRVLTLSGLDTVFRIEDGS